MFGKGLQMKPSTRLRNSAQEMVEKSWIARRKSIRVKNRKFNRKAALKFQFILCLLGVVYIFLPEMPTGNIVNTFFGFDSGFSEETGFRILSDSSVNETTNSSLSQNDTITAAPKPSQFPDGVFTLEQRKKGALIVNMLVMFYMFLGLAIVCDEYFEPSLQGICSDLNLKEDVAGATFMAAGGSAPELFSSIIGVFITEDDIGFGTIVGSATFNVLFVIAMCSFITYNLALSWWPLTRDSVFYCFSIVVLVVCIFDNKVEYYEAIVLLVMYGLYITIMYYNESLESWMQRQVEISKRPMKGWRLSLQGLLEHPLFQAFIYTVIISNVIVVILDGTGSQTFVNELNTFFSAVFILEMLLKWVAYTFMGYWRNPLNAFDGTLAMLVLMEVLLEILNALSTSSSESGGTSTFSGAFRILRFLRMARTLRIFKLYMASFVEKADACTQVEESDWKMLESPDYLHQQLQKASTAPIVRSTSKRSSSVAPAPFEPEIRGFESKAGSEIASAEPVSIKEEKECSSTERQSRQEETILDLDDDDDEPCNPFEIPDGGPFDKFMWAFAFPLNVCMYFTIPDCRREIFKRFYFLTFIMCIIWIAALAYVMVWMATVFGTTLEIPEAILGLTLIAAGTSIPDLLSSMAVARRGYGDMAVSSSIGSNIFDILVGLPVPWFLKTAVVSPGSSVVIQSCGLTIIVLTLFIMVAAVVSIIHWSNWVMSKRLGISMIVLYFLFVIESVVLELALSCKSG